MTGPLKEGFKKSTRKSLAMPVISVADGIEDTAYLKLRAPLRRKWETLPREVQEALSTEIQRLKTMGSAGHEYGSTIDYVSLILALPWQKTPMRKVSLKTAARKLDATHYGMEKTKDKSIEVIATLNRGAKSGGAICLDGSPGVGKTSVALSIAHAMGRKAVKIPMGGVSDQTHIRGHRRTYSGALPGAIIDAIRKAGTTNPVIILDEGDKMGEESKNGNPAAALLEALDPEQNSSFKDHYLNLEFDVSDVLFIVTTNDVDKLPVALIDRLEIISVNSYSSEEKMHIARNYLIPKHMERCGIEKESLTIDDTAISLVIEDYTRESGVRGLERLIKDICRKTNVALQKNLTTAATITAENVGYLLGPPRIHKNHVPKEDLVGVTSGLYFSSVGGGIIPIQVSTRPNDKFNITVTGLAGKMIEESVRYSVEMIRRSAERYGIETAKLDKTNIHVHLVDGASPKDGPSAGTAITTAILSSLMNLKTRHDVAMTGEIDLHGNVLPIGGVKEKLEGAYKAGATTVLIPWDNQRDLYDVPKNLQAKLNIIPVRHIDDVLLHTLVEKPLRPRLHLAAVANPDSTSSKPTAEEIERVVRFMAESTDFLQGTIRRLTSNKPDPS